MRLDLILLAALAGPSAAVPCGGMKAYHSFRRSWSSASTRLNSVLADLPTIYRGGGTIPPGAVAFTTSVITASAPAAKVTSPASVGPVVTVSASTAAAPAPSANADANSGSVSANPSTRTPRVTTITTFVTEFASPSPSVSEPNYDSTLTVGNPYDDETDSTENSMLRPRQNQPKDEGSSLAEKEKSVQQLRKQSQKLWNTAHKLDKEFKEFLGKYEKKVKRFEKKVNSLHKTQKRLDEERLAISRVKPVIDQALTYARTQERLLEEAKEELEKLRRNKAKSEVQNQSHGEILKKEDFEKHASSHNKRSEPREHEEYKKEEGHKKHGGKGKEGEDRKEDDHEKQKEGYKPEDHEQHENETKTSGVIKEATAKVSQEEYQDKFYEKIGDQIQNTFGGNQSEPITTEKEDKPVYMVANEVKVYKCHKCHKVDGCKHKESIEVKVGKAKEIEAKGGVKEEVKEELKEEDDEMLAGGNEGEQHKRLCQLYMQYRAMLVKAIQKQLDPILKDDQFPEDKEMAEQHKNGNEKEQRKRLNRLYMGYRYMLLPKWQEKLDPILHDDHQKETN